MADYKDSLEVKTDGGRASVVVEEPLSLRIDGAVFNLVRTPGCEQELAVGFCFSEGVIASIKDVLSFAYTERGDETARNTIDVRLSDEVAVDRTRLIRAVNRRAGSSLSGREMIDDLITRGHTWKRAAVPPPKIHVKRETLAEIPAILRESQVLHTKTGAAQAAAVFTAEGRLIVCREDIGRHNALDKAIGHLLIAKMDIRDKVLVLSGPVTYELMAKAYHSGFSVVCALAEPTSLAVAIAEKGDITLIGSLAAKGMTIYAHPERVT